MPMAEELNPAGGHLPTLDSRDSVPLGNYLCRREPSPKD
jgi:hypothetical protein